MFCPGSAVPALRPLPLRAFLRHLLFELLAPLLDHGNQLGSVLVVWDALG